MLADEHTRYLFDLLNYIAQGGHGITLVPLHVTGEALQRVASLPANYSKDVNLAPGYANGFDTTLRELVQNHADQCKELSRPKAIVPLELNDTVRQAAAAVGITQLFILIEDLQEFSPGASNGAAASHFPATSKCPANTLPSPEYSSSSAPFIVGLICEYYEGGQVGHGRLCVDLVNYSTILNPDMFRMGDSEKEHKSHAAGHFGEGMKVQINRLIHEFKVDINIITGPCCWTFKHVRAAHQERPTLHLLSSPLTRFHGHPTAATMAQQLQHHASISPNLSQETIVTIAGLPAGKPSIDSSQFLFLQPALKQCAVPRELLAPDVQQYLSPNNSQLLGSLLTWYPKVTVQDGDFCVELLFDPKMHGKLFLHGILLRPMCDSKQQSIHFGVNYVGSTKVLQSYALNRDRTNINVNALLCWLLCKVIHLLAVNKRPEQWCVLAHAYDALSQDLDLFSSMKWSFPIGGELLEYTTTAKQLQMLLRPAAGLAEDSGIHPYPCSNTASEADMSEVRLLGFHPVKTSSTLIDLWTTAGDMKSIAQLWDDRRSEVLAMKDARESWGPVEKQQSEQLLSTLASLLAPLGPKLNLPPTPAGLYSCMKVLGLRTGSVYHDHVVIPFKPNIAAGQGALLVFEAEFLKSGEAGHQRLAKSFKHCPAGGSCGGKCMRRLLMKETMTALQKIGVSSSLIAECVMGECLDMAGPNIDKLGTQAAAATPDTSHSRPSFKTPLGDAAAAAGNYPHLPTSISGSLGGAPWAAPAAAGVDPFGNITIQQPNGVQVVVRSEQASRVGDGPVRNYDDNMTDEYVKASLFSHQARPWQGHLPGSKSGHGHGGLPEVMEVVHTCHEEQALVESKVWLDAGSSSSSSSSSTAWLYLPEGLASDAAIEGAACQLYSGLKHLFMEVFAAPGAAAAQPPQFFIYYDPDRSAIAFNRGGQLWFNAAASPDLSRARNPRYAVARFWFMVTCHELAHNKVKAHNSAFSDACQTITLEFSTQFWEYAARNCGHRRGG